MHLFNSREILVIFFLDLLNKSKNFMHEGWINIFFMDMKYSSRWWSMYKNECLSFFITTKLRKLKIIPYLWQSVLLMDGKWVEKPAWLRRTSTALVLTLKLSTPLPMRSILWESHIKAENSVSRCMTFQLPNGMTIWGSWYCGRPTMFSFSVFRLIS